MSEHIQTGSWEEIDAVVMPHRRFVLSSHINPDGDAVGSALAMKRILEAMGKDAMWVMDQDMHYMFHDFYRPGELRIHANGNIDYSDREVAILTDAGFYKRLGGVGDVFAALPAKKVRIDHHPPGEPFEGAGLIDTAAPSTTVLVYRYLRHLGLDLTPGIAEPIYLGLIVDTQNFHLPNTTVEAHHIAAHCLEAGVDPTRVYEPVFGTNRFSRLRLMSEAFRNLQVLFGGKVAVLPLSLDDFKAAGAGLGEDEGFSDLVRTIEGVRVGVYLREEPNGKVKVSWRAKGDIDVRSSAQAFGGGGHLRAAGALVRGTLDEVRQRVAEDLRVRAENGEIQ